MFSESTPPQSSRQFLYFPAIALLTLGSVIGMARPAQAQLPVTLPDAQLIEWDCPLTGNQVENDPPPVDPSPGALVADGDFVWYVTTAGAQRLVRFQPGYPKATATATCTWWNLDDETDPAADTISPAGLRLRPMGTTAYIRDLTNLQRIETGTNRKTRWDDGIESFSDVAVGKYLEKTRVFSTGMDSFAIDPDPDDMIDPPVEPTDGQFVLQRLTPRTDGGADLRRWTLQGDSGFVYLAGVDVHPDSTKSKYVFFSEPTANNIARLDMDSNMITRWSLGDVSVLGCDVTAGSMSPVVCQPRQIDVGYGGVVSAVTGSGHIIRLETEKYPAKLTVAPIPVFGLASEIGNGENNPIGISDNGVIGYTTAGGGLSDKVGMLILDGEPTTVNGVTTPASFFDVTVAATPQVIPRFAGPATPFLKNADAHKTDTSGGSFFEAEIALATPNNTAGCTFLPSDPDPSDGLDPDDKCLPSTIPRGIDEDPQGKIGDYYTAIGGSLLRISHVSLPTAAAGFVSGCGTVSATESITNPVTGITTSTETEKGTFNLWAYKSSPTSTAKGYVFYENRTSRAKVESLQITNLTFATAANGKNKASIDGLCKSDSDCATFRVNVVDNGYYWTSNKDTFEVVKNPDPVLGIGLAEGGKVTSGDIKISRAQ
jgi:hypothetical protein